MVQGETALQRQLATGTIKPVKRETAFVAIPNPKQTKHDHEGTTLDSLPT